MHDVDRCPPFVVRDLVEAGDHRVERVAGDQRCRASGSRSPPGPRRRRARHRSRPVRRPRSRSRAPSRRAWRAGRCRAAGRRCARSPAGQCGDRGERERHGEAEPVRRSQRPRSMPTAYTEATRNPGPRRPPPTCAANCGHSAVVEHGGPRIDVDDLAVGCRMKPVGCVHPGVHRQDAERAEHARDHDRDQRAQVHPAGGRPQP